MYDGWQHRCELVVRCGKCCVVCALPLPGHTHIRYINTYKAFDGRLGVLAPGLQTSLETRAHIHILV